MFQLTNSEYV